MAKKLTLKEEKQIKNLLDISKAVGAAITGKPITDVINVLAAVLSDVVISLDDDNRTEVLLTFNKMVIQNVTAVEKDKAKKPKIIMQ